MAQEIYTVLLSGSRGWTDPTLIGKYLRSIADQHPQVCLLHGGCRGVDLIGAAQAQQLGWSTQVFLPDWSIGPAAGPIRNARMLNEGNPDEVLAFPLNQSKGTEGMIRLALDKLHLPSEQRGKLKLVRVIRSTDQVNDGEERYVSFNEVEKEKKRNTL